MSSGKSVSFEELRHNPRLLGHFIKERIAGGYGTTNADRFDGTLANMARSLPASEQTSSAASDGDCSETQTR